MPSVAPCAALYFRWVTEGKIVQIVTGARMAEELLIS